jgi:hypothetical protein
MKPNKYYVCMKQIERAGRTVTVFPVISPTGEIYCAFTLADALAFKGHALLYRRIK